MPLATCDNCERPAEKRGLCGRHYQEARRTGALQPRQVHALTGHDVGAMTAVCAVCGPTSMHRNVSSRGDGRVYYRCATERKLRNAATAEARRATHLQRMYGITQADYDAMAERQEGACPICGKVEKMLHVDHNHETGKVRGLLCGPCNRGIGLFFDRPELLEAAARYLRG